ncbi:glycosyltransferase family 4 protein [Parasalinivibrio latis]|uniref:glycosyltransferase family 4 protein n=1 Tax=Parasalinivibrio latis TaxID=2952610 RepID=UPI0030E010AF
MKDSFKEDVWLLLDSSEMGGIESHVYQLAKGLRSFNIGVRVVFLSYYEKPHPLHTKLENIDVPFIVIEGGLFALLKQIKTLRPAILHTHGYKAGIYCRLLGPLIKTPVIASFHAGEIPVGKVRLYDFIDRYSAVLANRRLCVSEEIAQRLPVSSTVLDNFIDTENISETHGEHIAFVGRLSYEKGPDRFIDIASHFSMVQFHIYGDGPEKSNLIYNAPNNVDFHGHQNNMDQVWSEISLLIMPSRHEGLPMAALEAMSRGIPVIATSVGAMPKLIEHDTNGWLVQEDSSILMVDWIKHWFLMSDSQRETMRQKARHSIVTQYSSDVVIPQLLQHYHHFSDVGHDDMHSGKNASPARSRNN